MNRERWSRKHGEIAAKNRKVCNSRNGSQQRQVVEASRIVLSLVDGDVGNHGRQSIKSEGGPVEAIEVAPHSFGSQGHNSQHANENDVPEGIYRIEVEAIDGILVNNE